MIDLERELSGVRTAAIAGHVRPDGDAVGSCLALYHYLKKNYPEIEATVYLENVPESYGIIPGVEDICHDFHQDRTFDVFFCLDCADEKRLGGAAEYRRRSRRTVCVDHHVSNQGFGDSSYIVPDASSTSELIFGILDEEKLPFESAEALYMGIVHDTGVFRHSCTSPETLEIAARLMRKGINCSRITNRTYYDKTYAQNRILGKTLEESVLLMDGKVISGRVELSDMECYGVVASDLDGIVETMMGTTGVEVAIFLHGVTPQEYKVSLRSRELVDVSVIAAGCGGGGHVRAAGCNVPAPAEAAVEHFLEEIRAQLGQVENGD